MIVRTGQHLSRGSAPPALSLAHVPVFTVPILILLRSGGTTELLWSAVPTMNSFESGWEIFKPTVCAVQGPCIGYGPPPAAASLCL